MKQILHNNHEYVLVDTDKFDFVVTIEAHNTEAEVTLFKRKNLWVHLQNNKLTLIYPEQAQSILVKLQDIDLYEKHFGKLKEA